MGPGFESQRDHKKAQSKDWAFFVPFGGEPKGLIQERFRILCSGHAGLIQSQRDHKKAQISLCFFDFTHFKQGFSGIYTSR